MTNTGNARRRLWEMLGDEYGDLQVTTLGDDAGDDFGKYPLEDPESTSRFLGDGSGKPGSDEDGK